MRIPLFASHKIKILMKFTAQNCILTIFLYNGMVWGAGRICH